MKLMGTLIRETWHGKTIGRTLMNAALGDMALSGAILDLGSSTEQASYHRFLHYQEPYTLMYTDWYKSGGNIIKLDLERLFPIDSDIFDSITCFNVLEHVYDSGNLIRESYRILKLGGTFIGGVPFLVNYHPDPHDYFRYTHETINRAFTNAGFVLEKMTSLGFGSFTASLDISFHVFPKFIRPFVACVAIFLDALILKWRSSQRLRYPLGYVFVYKKHGIQNMEHETSM